MGENLIELKVLTKDGILFNGKVNSITVPSLSGEITLLPQHIPLLSALKTGEIKISNEKNSVQKISVLSGFIRFINNTCIVTAEQAKLKKAS